MEILSVEFKDTEILTERDLTDIARYIGSQKAFEIYVLEEGLKKLNEIWR